MKTKSKLSQAFADLIKLGYFAKQNHTCCNTCGWAEVPDEQANKAVFYHAQSNIGLEKGQFYLNWSGDGKEICYVFENNGIETEWDGNPDLKIMITVPQ